MKKQFTSLIVIFLVACSSKKDSIAPKNEIGNYNVNKNTISIITPYIEINEKSTGSYINHPDKRKSLTEFAINLLKSQFPKADYVEIPFLFKDYRTINSKVEGRASLDERDVPMELYSDKNSTSLFIIIFGYFGELNRGSIILCIIDNENKKWKIIEKYQFGFSPLNIKKLEKRLLKSLEKIK
jgi:hypothetical protein